MKPIEIMHQEFGIHSPPEKCKTCSNLHHIIHRDKSYYKCQVYGESQSQATDFRLKWTACGAYNQIYKGIPIKDAMKHSEKRQDDIQVEGQMELKLSECTKNNLCVDCESKTCLHAGKLIADCPKYYCDREGDFYEDCESCEFLKEFQREMRAQYDKSM